MMLLESWRVGLHMSGCDEIHVPGKALFGYRTIHNRPIIGRVIIN
jgi:hypothetical protein